MEEGRKLDFFLLIRLLLSPEIDFNISACVFGKLPKEEE